jgi:hypothetical protein
MCVSVCAPSFNTHNFQLNYFELWTFQQVRPLYADEEETNDGENNLFKLLALPPHTHHSSCECEKQIDWNVANAQLQRNQSEWITIVIGQLNCKLRICYVSLHRYRGMHSSKMRELVLGRRVWPVHNLPLKMYIGTLYAHSGPQICPEGKFKWLKIERDINDAFKNNY